MKYLNGLPSCPLGLKEFSRRAIRNSLPETTSRQISQVPLPASLKRYIKDYGLKYYVRVRHLDHTEYNNHNEVHDLKGQGSTYGVSMPDFLKPIRDWPSLRAFKRI